VERGKGNGGKLEKPKARKKGRGKPNHSHVEKGRFSNGGADGKVGRPFPSKAPANFVVEKNVGGEPARSTFGEFRKRLGTQLGARKAAKIVAKI